jgi:ribosomal protein S7
MKVEKKTGEKILLKSLKSLTKNRLIENLKVFNSAIVNSAPAFKLK